MREDEHMNRIRDINPYEEIINLPHHVSKKHPQMPLEKRAAQFQPFAALQGHHAAIEETARLTEREMLLDEDFLDRINERFLYLRSVLMEEPEVTISYFQPDGKKAGGSYQTITGIIKKIDDFRQYIVMEEGTAISLKYIVGIDGEIFSDMDD